MYNVADPKLFHSHFPKKKISAEEASYRKAVDELVKKVDFLSTVLSFLELDITMTACFTSEQELYFVITNTGFSSPRALIHNHSFKLSAEENLNTFSCAMESCEAEFEAKHKANLPNLMKHLGDLENLYLEVLSSYADL